MLHRKPVVINADPAGDCNPIPVTGEGGKPYNLFSAIAADVGSEASTQLELRMYLLLKGCSGWRHSVSDVQPPLELVNLREARSDIPYVLASFRIRISKLSR